MEWKAEKARINAENILNSQDKEQAQKAWKQKLDSNPQLLTEKKSKNVNFNYNQ